MRWLFLGLAGAVVFLYAQSSDNSTLSLLSKGLPVIAMLLWLRQAPAGTYRRWISIGLLFSLAGDLLLAWPDDLFVFGLGAFLIGHLAYACAYCSDSRRAALPGLLLALAAGGTMFAVLASHDIGALLIPVACYALVISLMLWRALARLGVAELQPRSTWLAAAGAALFVLSDSLIGISRFVTPFDGAGYAIILTYWFGQWGISASAFERTRA